MRYYMVMQYVSRVGNAMTCHRTGYDRCDIQMLAIQMCGLFSCVVDVDIFFFHFLIFFDFDLDTVCSMLSFSFEYYLCCLLGFGFCCDSFSI